MSLLVSACRTEQAPARACPPLQSAKIFADMLDEILMDVVLQSHQEIARSVAVCDICHTRYAATHPAAVSFPTERLARLADVARVRLGWSCVWCVCADGVAAHAPGPSNLANGSQDASQDGTNGFDAATAHSNGADTPNGTIYLECTNCKRQVRIPRAMSPCTGADLFVC